MKLTSFRTRAGLTLIELLIVMAVLIVLASVALGAMKSLLRGQKVAQASVSVKQYLQNAQIRAVASGRPVAVFFDRISMTGSGATPVPANYSSTRLQFGEVFPPYTGDVENTVGRLVEEANQSGTRYGYANAIVFEPTIPPNAPPLNAIENVTAGFGAINGGNLIGGFISVGDVIEFDDCQARYSITSIRPNVPAMGAITVSFSNPKVSKVVRSGTTTDYVNLPMPLPNGAMVFKRFRVYRQPTRSLVGALVLPRGTCVDLSLSGVGVADSGIEGGTFFLNRAPDANGTATSGDYSRIGVVFYSDGKIAYIMDENTKAEPNLRPKRLFLDASNMIYLMVGRTDQVLPGYPASNLKTSALQDPDYGAGDLPRSNLLDPENIWITCNPLTGEIKSSPVADLDKSTVEARWTRAQSNVNEGVSDLIIQARSLATAGITN